MSRFRTFLGSSEGHRGWSGPGYPLLCLDFFATAMANGELASYGGGMNKDVVVNQPARVGGDRK